MQAAECAITKQVAKATDTLRKIPCRRRKIPCDSGEVYPHRQGISAFCRRGDERGLTIREVTSKLLEFSLSNIEW